MLSHIIYNKLIYRLLTSVKMISPQMDNRKQAEYIFVKMDFNI